MGVTQSLRASRHKQVGPRREAEFGVIQPGLGSEFPGL